MNEGFMGHFPQPNGLCKERLIVEGKIYIYIHQYIVRQESQRLAHAFRPQHQLLDAYFATGDIQYSRRIAIFETASFTRAGSLAH